MRAPLAREIAKTDFADARKPDLILRIKSQFPCCSRNRCARVVLERSWGRESQARAAAGLAGKAGQSRAKPVNHKEPPNRAGDPNLARSEHEAPDLSKNAVAKENSQAQINLTSR